MNKGETREVVNKNWGQDIIKAKLTQAIRGEERERMDNKQKVYMLISNIITSILSALAGFFGAN